MEGKSTQRKRGGGTHRNWQKRTKKYKKGGGRDLPEVCPDLFPSAVLYAGEKEKWRRRNSTPTFPPIFWPHIYNMAQRRARKYSEKNFFCQVARQQGCKDCTLKSCHGRHFPKFSPDLCSFSRQLVNPPPPVAT